MRNSPNEWFFEPTKLPIKKWVAILIVCLPYFVSSQTILKPQILYSNLLGQKEGLLQLNVQSMALDSLGFLWVATEDGLHRFNGYKFKPYLHDPNDTSSISDDHIRGLLFSNNKLWMASNSKGILWFEPAQNRFFNVYTNQANSDLNSSNKIIQLNADTLLFSTKNNLIVCSEQQGIQCIIELPESIKESIITDVLHLDNKFCWLSTTASGIIKMDKLTGKYVITDLLKNNTNNCLLKILDKIYIGTEKGLFIYDIKTKSLANTTLNSHIKCFYKKSETEFYIGTDLGLLNYNIKESSITPYILQTSENIFHEQVSITQILGDTIGNLWIGTEGDGLIYCNTYQKKFNPIKIRLKEYPLNKNISSFQFLKDDHSNLWIGTRHGMVKYLPTSNEFKLYKNTGQPMIYALTKDQNGTIWAGGFTSDLLRYNPTSDSFENMNTTLPDKDIVEIIPIDKNTLWICTWAGGIHKYTIDKNSFEQIFINGKRINSARTSFIDSKENIWIGNELGAYMIAKSGIVKHFDSSDDSEIKLSGTRIFSIQEDNNANIWFGTNVGLTRWNPSTNETTLYYKQKGLPNDFIYSVQVANNNSIWVSTNYGISVLNQQTNTFKNYTTSDGLQNNEFNGKAGYKDEEGNLYFGGISGINIFNPGDIIENPHLPNTFIESVELFNTPLGQNELYKKELRFQHHENVLTFNFVALNYLNPEKCNYMYKMEGFDTNWRPVTKNRSTTYTNLDPGNYIFKVKGTNDIGVWNETAAEMKIIMVPPWYETNWFRGIFLIVFLLSGILFYMFQTTKLKRAKLKLERIVAHRTQQIITKNKALENAVHETEKQKDSISFLMKELRHRVKNNLQIISSLLNIQSNTMKDESAIEALRMAKNRIITISYIENKINGASESIEIGAFIKEISETILNALSGEENIKYAIQYNLCKQQLTKINTTLIGLILNELITNATKYAFNKYKPENTVTIGCNINHNMLSITISDNGKGYEPAGIRQNSMGIDLVKDMVKQMGGTWQIDSLNGTKNYIEIPIN